MYRCAGLAQYFQVTLRSALAKNILCRRYCWHLIVRKGTMDLIERMVEKHPQLDGCSQDL